MLAMGTWVQFSLGHKILVYKIVGHKNLMFLPISLSEIILFIDDMNGTNVFFVLSSCRYP